MSAMPATPGLQARLDAALDRVEGAGLFGPGSPPAADDLRAAQALRPMPPLLARLYGRANGISCDRVDVLDIEEYQAINEQRELFEDLPGCVAFGGSRGDDWFILDPGDMLGEGAETVHRVDRGELTPDACRPVAPDLPAFLDEAVAGAAFEGGRTLAELALDRLFDAIARRPDAVDLRPGLGEDALFKAMDSGLPVGFGLVDLYRRADGLLLPDVGIRVDGVGDLAAVEATRDETGRPGALWAGSGPGGVRLAVTTGGWRGLPPDRLIMVAPGADIATAAPVGRLADALRGWIGEEGA